LAGKARKTATPKPGGGREGEREGRKGRRKGKESDKKYTGRMTYGTD
jgi:hypothetical protein